MSKKNLAFLAAVLPPLFATISYFLIPKEVFKTSRTSVRSASRNNSKTTSPNDSTPAATPSAPQQNRNSAKPTDSSHAVTDFDDNTEDDPEEQEDSTIAQNTLSPSDLDEVKDAIYQLNTAARAPVATLTLDKGVHHVKILPEILFQKKQLVQLENSIDEINEISQQKKLEIRSSGTPHAAAANMSMNGIQNMFLSRLRRRFPSFSIAQPQPSNSPQKRKSLVIDLPLQSPRPKR